MMSSRSDAMREVTDMPAPYFVMPVVLHVEDEVVRVKDETALGQRCCWNLRRTSSKDCRSMGFGTFWLSTSQSSPSCRTKAIQWLLLLLFFLLLKWGVDSLHFYIYKNSRSTAPATATGNIVLLISFYKCIML